MPTLTEHSNIPRLARLTGIQSKDIPVIWGAVCDFLRQGLNEGESLSHIQARLKVLECQLWVAYDADKILAACVTELVFIGNRKVCNIITVGGTQMETWLRHMETIEAWARENQCAAMRFPEIRPGWAKVLKDFKVTKINLEKAL